MFCRETYVWWCGETRVCSESCCQSPGPVVLLEIDPPETPRSRARDDNGSSPVLPWLTGRLDRDSCRTPLSVLQGWAHLVYEFPSCQTRMLCLQDPGLREPETG